MRLKVILRSEEEPGELNEIECFGSDVIADLHQRLALTDDQVLVATEPYRRVLPEPLRLCHVVCDLNDLLLPIELVLEQKVLVAFEPIGLEHLRQKLLVSLSATPLDLYDEISERFQLCCEHRLSYYGNPLDNSCALKEQFFDLESVIQIDMVRPFLIHDLWNEDWDFLNDDMVYLYSTESSLALFGRHVLQNQRLFYDNIQLTIFGSVVDIFGSTVGYCDPVHLINSDIQRDFHFLSFDEIQRRLGWSQDHFSDVLPTKNSRNPKEVMCYGQLVPQRSRMQKLRLGQEALFTINPLKVIVKEKKKLRIHRVAHGSTTADLCAEMKQRFHSSDVRLQSCRRFMDDDAINRRMELELFLLERASRFQTRLTVTFSDRMFGCWYEAEVVKFTDVVISLGKQAKVSPRTLFSRCFYCCGCGRRISREEEPHQTIPSNCCSVRSMQLTDRRRRDVGVQVGSRRRDVTCYTFDPLQRDACIDTEYATGRAIVQTSTSTEIAIRDQQRGYGSRFRKMPTPLEMAGAAAPIAFAAGASAASFGAAAPIALAAAASAASLVRVSTIDPGGSFKESTVSVTTGGQCSALLDLERMPKPDGVVLYTQEIVYLRQKVPRRAVQCFDESSGNLLLVDFADSVVPRNSSWLLFARRFFQLADSLPTAPRHMPRVFILTDTDVGIVDEEGSFSPTPHSALVDPAYITSMTGIYSDGKLYWELVGDSFADASTGKVYWRRGWIPKSAEKRHVLALLKDGDRVPKAAVPPNKVLRVFRRAGLEPSIEGELVKCPTRPREARVDLQLWDSPIKIGSFDKEFTHVARRK